MTDACKLDRSPFSIVPIGSAAKGFALKLDGVIVRSNPSALPLAAYVDARLAGASDLDAHYIAEAVSARPWPPSYEERTALQPGHERHGPTREPFSGEVD
jgi:hypothetical protein